MSPGEESKSAVGAWRQLGLGLGLGLGGRVGVRDRVDIGVNIAGFLYLRLGITIASVFTQNLNPILTEAVEVVYLYSCHY